MHHRLVLAGLAATGGLLTTAFLQVAVAAADVGADGADAFTIGSYTFDPFTVARADVEGFDPVAQLSSAPPLLDTRRRHGAWHPPRRPGLRGV